MIAAKFVALKKIGNADFNFFFHYDYIHHNHNDDIYYNVVSFTITMFYFIFMLPYLFIVWVITSISNLFKRIKLINVNVYKIKIYKN